MHAQMLYIINTNYNYLFVPLKPIPNNLFNQNLNQFHSASVIIKWFTATVHLLCILVSDYSIRWYLYDLLSIYFYL